MLSLNARLTLTASLVLVAFLGLTGLALERAFRDAGLAAVEDRLRAHIYTLLAGAEIEGGVRLVMPRALPEARLALPDSGLYARIVDAEGATLWQSDSLLGFSVPFPATGADGVGVFAPVSASDGRALFAMSFSVLWQLDAGGERRFTFQVAESRDVLGAQRVRFRRSLWGWLAAAAVALLLTQGLVLRYGLAPLRRVASELAAIESGARKHLSARYPRELGRLTERINAFIDTGRGRLDRSRNALAELAHSLKTPLAVLQSMLDGGADGDQMRRGVREQTARMRDTIDHQLQRAAASGPTPLAPGVRLAPLLERLADSLLKVYVDKGLSVDIDVDADLALHADEGDLMEIFGNLLDNACKWAGKRVRVKAARGNGTELRLRVEDDGPGIAADKVEAVMARGGRADATTPGHGIGLAVVHDIVVEAYGGQVDVGASELGGTAVEIRLRRR